MMTQIEVRSDLTVIGYNPENADLDRPNGEIVGERFYMFATDEKGNSRVWGWFDSVEACERGFQFDAPAVEEWSHGRPTYGSEAWDTIGQEKLDAEAERDAYEFPAFEPTAFQRIY